MSNRNDPSNNQEVKDWVAGPGTTFFTWVTIAALVGLVISVFLPAGQLLAWMTGW